jgi:hypothetical protein
MMVSSEKPHTKASRPAAPVRTLGRGGQAKVGPATNSVGPVQTKSRELKHKMTPGSTGPFGRPSDPLMKFVETHDVPLHDAPTVGFSTTRQYICIDRVTGPDG